MDLITLFRILLISSLLMLTPVFETEKKITIIQDTTKSIIINVHTPKLRITSDNLAFIFFNITYMNPLSNTNSTTEELFQSSTEVKTSTPGTYLIDILAPEITNIAIKGAGVYSLSIILILVLSAVNAAFFIRDNIVI